MFKPIDDYGELHCQVCDTVIRCNECGDMPERCPGCGTDIDYSDYED